MEREIPEIIKDAKFLLGELSNKDPEEMITRKECMDIVSSSIQYTMWTMVHGNEDK